jgi:uncharacterized membrane protein YbhN (UPF0104 family)
MTEKRKKLSIYTLIRWVGTVLAFGLVVYLLYQQGWDQIWGAVRQIGVERFAIAIGLMAVSRLMMVGRWYVLMISSEEKFTFVDGLKLTFAGLFANNFLPSTVGGDVVRLAGAVQAGYDGVISAASLIVDRLVGMFGMALVLPIGLYRTFQVPNLFASLASPGAFVTAGVLPASVTNIWEKIRDKGKALLKRLLEAVALWIRQPKVLLSSLLFTGIHMLCFFGILWILLDGMSDPVPYWLVGGLWSLVYFVTLIPISINGLGVQEVAITFAFSTLGGASEANTLTLALLFRTLVMLASLPGALFIPGIMPDVNKQN